MLRLKVLASFLLASVFSAAHPLIAVEPAIDSIDALWAGFDPRATPLEVEVIKAWDEEGVHLEMLYFTGEIFEGEKTRVFAYLGRPKAASDKLPGVLHIHGGGQTANLDWARFWGKRDYVCVSFDFCGNTNQPHLGPEYRRERYTLWGKVPADMVLVGGGTKMLPTLRHNPWYHWALTARRGLTMLEAQPDVNPGRLGIFGVSVGGTLCWTVAGVDPRVKAAVPIYGCGWEFYPYPPDLDAPAPDELKLWRKLIAPEAHAGRIACPLLFLSGTNDGHGKMDLAYRTLDGLVSPIRRQLFTPNYDHHVEPAEAASLPLWMDTHLKERGSWPKTPRLAFIAGTVPTVQVVPDRPDDVERVEIFYCLNSDWPMARFWRKAVEVRRVENQFVGQTPFLAKTDRLLAFANVVYRSGHRVSSRLEQQDVAELSSVEPTLSRQTLIDDMETSADWNWVPAYTDPNREGTAFFSQWKDTGGERGFTLDPAMFPRDRPSAFYFGTRKIGDPQFSGVGRTVLLLDYLAEQTPETLTVRLSHRLPQEYASEFTAKLLLADSGGEPSTKGWRTLRMEPSQFKGPNDKPLPNWDHVENFILHGTSAPGKPPVFKRLRWWE